MRSWFRTLLYVAVFAAVCLIGWAVVVAVALWVYTTVTLWLGR